MALEPCPECGSQKSTSATACPHCGYVFKTLGSPLLWFFVVLYVVLSLIGLVFWLTTI